MSDSQTLTRALLDLEQGDASAHGRLMAIAYEELRRVARSQLRRLRPGQTLNTTGLVHETYLKLVDQRPEGYSSRAHFLAIMAKAMRQILIDYARRASAQKRGGGQALISLEDLGVGVSTARPPDWVLELDAALEQLAEVDARLVQVVECRFFAGMTEEETAEALESSLRTVQRQWKMARAWLKEAMSPEVPA
jgi:RNA polymerase sigma factor (TIGR02999 family)